MLQNPNGNSITASFNALGCKQWVIGPNMGLQDLSYSALGEVFAETDATGQMQQITLVNAAGVLDDLYYCNPCGSR